MFKLSPLDKISFILVMIGALNWGLIGLTNIDLVEVIFGNIPLIQRFIYIIIGAAAIDIIVLLLKNRFASGAFKR